MDLEIILKSEKSGDLRINPEKWSACKSLAKGATDFEVVDTRMANWCRKKISGILLDITGVLYDGGPEGGVAIPGSIDAVKRLKASGIPVRFCTNETTTTRRHLVGKLKSLGYEITPDEIFSPIPAVCKVLKQRGLRPYLVVAKEALPAFEGINQENPNCVVIADGESQFSYENLNKAFQILMALEKPVLISLGKGKYYKHDGELVLDVGPFMKALEYACDIEAEIVGKPSQSFFLSALEDTGATADECIMIGDDIISDVGGAQKAGLRGIQVRTGKFQPEHENHPTVKPDGYVDNLAQAVDLILGSNQTN